MKTSLGKIIALIQAVGLHIDTIDDYCSEECAGDLAVLIQEIVNFSDATGNIIETLTPVKEEQQ
jgi:hypothetical protein